jgi:class 3 adenylate cyclase
VIYETITGYNIWTAGGKLKKEGNMASINEQVLDEKLTELESVRSWSPRVISKLETLIRTGDDFDLFRVNPMQYATERNMNSEEAVDLFLYATKAGLFEMEWNLLCPSCGNVIESFNQLGRLHNHAACAACSTDMQVSLDEYIQVTFTISLRIRDNIFRRPDALSIEDYFYKYAMSKDLAPTEEANDPDLAANLALLLKHVQPTEKVNVEVNLIPGVLLLRDFTKNPVVVFAVGDQPADDGQHVVVHVADGQYRSISHPVAPGVVQTGPITHRPSQMGYLQRGRTMLEIENRMGESTPLWVSNFTFDFASRPVQFRPFVSGKKLLTTQTFRSLFRSEVIQTDEGIGVEDITFLFTDLKGSTEMYDRIGDAKAYYLVRQHFDTLNRVVAQNCGAVVKTIGDAVMATFLNPADAMNAALAMLRDIDEFNRGITEDLILKIGIHRGHSIVVTLNERLDYFGQTVNIAARVQGLADAGEIYITEDAYQYPGVEQIIESCEVVAMQSDVKGVRSRLNVYKVELR